MIKIKRYTSLLLVLMCALIGVAQGQTPCSVDQGGCGIRIEMTDDFSDGWDDGNIKIEVYQNDTLRGEATLLDGANGNVTIGVCPGPVTFKWAKASNGVFPEDCGFIIINGDGDTIYECPVGYASSWPSGYVIAMDTVRCPSCLNPTNLHTIAVTDSNAVLCWSPGGNENEWLLQMGDSVLILHDTMYTVSGLLANTQYLVSVRAVCEPGDTSMASTVSFVTACGMAAQLPYYEDFEISATDAVPHCWHLLEYSQGSYDLYPSPSVASNSSIAHGGNQYLNFYTRFNAGSVASPLIPLPANRIEVVLWAKGDPIEVGFVSELDDSLATYMAVDTLTPGASSYEEFAVSFQNLDITDTGYVVIRKSSVNYTYSMVDDVIIREISVCDQPVGFTAVSDNDNSVTFVWNDSVGQMWQIAYGPQGTAADAMSLHLDSIEGQIAVVNGLSHAMCYDFYLRTVCDDRNSYWVGPVTVQPGLRKMPLTGSDTLTGCDFYLADDGGLLNNYTYYTDGTVVIYPADGDSAVHISGSMSLFSFSTLYIYDGASTTTELIQECHGAMNVDVTSTTGPLTLRMVGNGYGADNTSSGFLFHITCAERISCAAPYQLSVSEVADGSAIAQWQYGDETAYFLLTATDTITGQQLHFSTYGTTYQLTGLAPSTPYSLKVCTLCGEGDTSVAIYANFQTSCFAPILYVADSASGSLLIAWHPGGVESEWRFAYRLANDTMWVVLDSVTTDTIHWVGGLEPEQLYEFQVTSLCGDSVAEAQLFARTTVAPYQYCNPIALYDTVAFFEDFETDDFPDCWNQLRLVGNHRWLVTYNVSYPDNAHSGDKVLAFLHENIGDSTLAVLPPFDFSQSPYGGYLSFWHAQVALLDGQDHLYLYYRLSDTTDWILIDNYFSEYDEWTNEGILLPASSNAPYYQLAFGAVDGFGRGVKIDDVLVQASPSCETPANLQLSVITPTRAVLLWQSGADAFELQYKAVSDTAWVSVTTNITEDTLLGLIPMERYQARVRALCDSGDVSWWSNVCMFQTTICPEGFVQRLHPDSIPYTNSYQLPVNNYYNYSYSQQIFRAEEMVGEMDIDAVQFFYSGADPSLSKNHCKVYIGHTMQRDFGVVINYIPIDSLQLVYEGTLNCHIGWNTFRFTQPFAYDGVRNIVVAVADSSNGYDNENSTFAVYSDTIVSAWYAQSDSQYPNPAQLDAYSGQVFVTEKRNAVRLVACDGVCIAPTITSLTNDYGSATLAWNGYGNVYEVAIKEIGDLEWRDSLLVVASSYTFQPLYAATSYQVGVRQQCSNGEYSPWVVSSITTDSLECSRPEDFTVQTMSFEETSFGWTANANAQKWVLHFMSNEERYDTVATNPAHVRGLVAGSTYEASVRSICGNGASWSDWSDTISFTTDPCLPVENIWLSDTTAHSVALHWSAGYGHERWLISYGSQNPEQGYFLLSEESDFLLTGLSSNTEYPIFLRAYCADAIYSDWSNGISFKTLEDASIVLAQEGLVSIYPNPTANHATVLWDEDYTIQRVEVINLRGQVCYSADVLSGKSHQLPKLSSGTYFVRLISNEVAIVEKLVVKWRM